MVVAVVIFEYKQFHEAFLNMHIAISDFDCLTYIHAVFFDLFIKSFCDCCSHVSYGVSCKIFTKIKQINVIPEFCCRFLNSFIWARHMNVSAYLSEIYSTKILKNPQLCSSLGFHTVGPINMRHLSLLLSKGLH